MVTFKQQLITALISSPIIYISHYDFGYIDDVLRSFADQDPHKISPIKFNKDDIMSFDAGNGLMQVYDSTQIEPKKEPDLQKTLKSFVFAGDDYGRAIFSKDDPGVLVLKNIFPSLKEASIQGLLLAFVDRYERGIYPATTSIIIIGMEPVSSIPSIIESISTIVDLPSPKEIDIRNFIDSLYSDDNIEISNQFKEDREEITTELIKTLQGLELFDINKILRASLCRNRNKISKSTIRYALEEKKQIVKKSGIIEVVDTDERLDNVGGLENLIDEIERKKIIFQHLSLAQNKVAGVPLPKGVLIIGMPGCGKSMIAKSIASEFNVALLRLDVNRLMGKYVGESESNLRRALKTAEAAHPCVLWIDEIEKAFAGTDSGNNDIIIRLMGHFLTWMQERKTAVYVVATANDTLKPELMRKGRFDDVFFVDFPNKKEAKSILVKTINRYSRTKLYDWSAVKVESAYDSIIDKLFKGASHGFSGAEINALVGTVVENAFREYVQELDKNNSSPHTLSPVAMTINKFETVINEMKDYVMSRQLEKKDTDSAILRISKLKDTFSIKSASKR